MLFFLLYTYKINYLFNLFEIVKVIYTPILGRHVGVKLSFPNILSLQYKTDRVLSFRTCKSSTNNTLIPDSCMKNL